MAAFDFKTLMEGWTSWMGTQAEPAHHHEEEAPADPFHIPKALEAPEAGEGPEIKKLDFEALGEFLEKKPAAAAAPTPAPKSTSAADESKYQAGFHTEGGKEWMVGAGQVKREGGETTQRGIAAGPGHVEIGTQTATKSNDEGKMVDGHGASAGLSKDGLNLNVSSTTDEKTAKAGVVIGRDATGGSASFGDEKHSTGFSFATGANQDTFGMNIKRGPIGGSASVTEYKGGKSGKIGEEGADESIHEIMGGEAQFIERDSGHAEKVGLTVSNGMFGAGGEYSHDHKDVARYFRKGEEAIAPAAGMMPGLAPTPLDGKAGFTDVDVSALKAGEGYSFEEQRGNAEKGSVTAVLTASLGREHATQAQTVIARDDKGQLRVVVSEGDQTKLTGSVDWKGTGVSASESEANASKVAFTAHGKEGEAAVKTFQTTGLLPGAEAIAQKSDPAAVGAFAQAREAWLVANAKVDPNDLPGWQARVAAARATMMEAAGPVNQAFQQHRGNTLDEAAVPGVEYDEHSVAHQQAHDASLSLLGLDLFKAGFSETETDTEYRADGKAHTEKDYHRTDSYWFASTEDSHIAMDPKGYKKDGDAVGMVVASQQEVGDDQRETLAKLGPAAFGMPKEAVEAWKTGDMHTGHMQKVALTMTESQLAEVRDRVAPADAERVERAVRSVKSLYAEQASANTVEGQMAAMTPFGAGARENKELADEINPLYQEAAKARMAQLAREGKFAELTKMTMGTMTGGEDMVTQELAHVSGVKSKEDFLKLTPEEQKLVITTGAIANVREGRSSFDEMGLVLQVKDRKQRDELMRQLYETDERRKKGADSTVNLIGWLETEGAKTVGPDETKKLLAGAAVRAKDDELDAIEKAKAKADGKEAGSGNKMLGEGLANTVSVTGQLATAMTTNLMTADNLEKTSAERAAAPIVRYLEAAHGTANVEATLDVAMKSDPEFLQKMHETLKGDPARAAQVAELLQGTKYDAIHQMKVAQANAMVALMKAQMANTTAIADEAAEQAKWKAMFHYTD